jgi:hypothetical protein
MGVPWNEFAAGTCVDELGEVLLDPRELQGNW